MTKIPCVGMVAVIRCALLVSLAFILIISGTAESFATLAEPDVVYYGEVIGRDGSGQAVALNAGKIAVNVYDGTMAVFTREYWLGSDPAVGFNYLLRIPVYHQFDDPLNPQPRKARVGDMAIFTTTMKVQEGEAEVDVEVVLGRVRLAERGAYIHLTLDTEFEADGDEDGLPDGFPTNRFGDGQGDANGNGISDLAEFLSGNDPAACIWQTGSDETQVFSNVLHPLVLQNCLKDAEGDRRHNLINLAQGTYRGNYAYLAAWAENFDLKVIGGYAPDFSMRDYNPASTVLDGDVDNDGIGNGAVFAADTDSGKSTGNIRVESLTFKNGRAIEMQGGGGIQARLYRGALELVGNIISSNSADNGGGLYLESSDSAEIFLANNIIHGNIAVNAAAVRIASTIGPVTLLNNTVADNTSTSGNDGRSLLIETTAASVDLTNNIIRGTSPVTGAEIFVNTFGIATPLVIVRNDFDLAGGLYVNTPGFVLDPSNIDADPQFAAPFKADFRLGTGSPCIDSGILHAKQTDKDAVGVARALGSGIDLGAYEFSLGVVTIDPASLAHTYDGTAKSATATTIPADLPVLFTYNGLSEMPVAAGSYAVVATINDINYQGIASGTLIIGKGTATFILGSLSQSHDGTAKPVTATTAPAGKAVTFTYDGSPTVPTNAGSYAVVGTVSDANYQGTASGTLVIGKGTATVNLGSLSQTYDGTAKAASAITAPTGKAVTFTYDGSPTAPTNAGSYAVVGTISDVNYQGTASGTLVIGKGGATVTLGSLSQTFDGTAKAASATTTPAGKAVTFTYDGSPTAPTNAGSYTVVGTVNDANYTGTASGTLVIGKGGATVTLGSLSQTYDGTVKPVTATTAPAGKAVTFTYDGLATTPINTGSYAVVATINDANYQGTASGTLVIGKGGATVTLGSLSQTFDGTAKAATATTAPTGKAVSFTYDGSPTAPTNAGSFAVVGTVNDANYTGTAFGTLVIGKGGATVTLGSLSQTYDGTAKPVTATTAPVGKAVTFTYDGFATAPINTGSYAVVATINDANYQGTASGTLVIGKGNAVITLANISQTYDGKQKIATATTTPAGKTVTFTYDGLATAPINAGSYAVVGTVSDANYQGTASGTLVIGHNVAVINMSNLHHVYDGTAKTATATTNPTGKSVSFTYNGSPTAPISAGSYAVIATISDANYQGTANGTLVISDSVSPTLTLSTLASNTTTNNPALNVAGTVSDSDSGLKSVTVNGAGVTVAVDSTFSTAIVLLEGDNLITVVATDNTNNQSTETRTIALDTTAPGLTLTQPADNSFTGVTVYEFTGSVDDPNAIVTAAVNGGSPVTATMNGTSFSCPVNLESGLNTVDITLVDQVGNSTGLKRTMTLDTIAPTVEITVPDTDTIVGAMPVTITGTVNDALTEVSLVLTVNDVVVTPTVSGSTFSYELTATEGGSFRIQAIATDLLGNSATVTRNIIYHPSGDADGNDTVEVADALKVLKMAVGLETPDPAKGDAAPLVGGKPQPDGKVNAADALIILRRAIGDVNW